VEPRWRFGPFKQGVAVLKLGGHWANRNGKVALGGASKLGYRSRAITWAFFMSSLVWVGTAGSVGQFEKVYASTNSAFLTEWARRYESGEGVVANSDHAIRLYCKAARQGYADAQYYLGWLYAHGRGVKRDDGLAAAWFKMAAANNHLQSRNLLQLLHVAPKGKATCPTGGISPTPSKGGSRRERPPVELADLVRVLSAEYELNPDLVLAVVQVESNFNPNALSPKNGQGLMQLIPETAQRFGVKDVWDPEQNLRGGMAYLRWLLDHFEGDVTLALAGYNAGEATVQRYQGVPPFGETQDYVSRVNSILGD